MIGQNTHPSYTAYASIWTMMRDCYEGEIAIKSKGESYLPPTSSMIIDGYRNGGIGYDAYQRYKTRAVYHDYVQDAVKIMIGMLHHKDAVIELPEGLEYMRYDATYNGDSLQQLLRKINQEQLTVGRCGLLLDVSEDGRLYTAMYNAESIVNWHQQGRDLQFVALDESDYAFGDGGGWTYQERTRYLEMQDGYYVSYDNDMSSVSPALVGKRLPRIPFVFVNSQDLAPAPHVPPLLGLANLSLAIYRGEADYRQNLFMQGQDTLVVIANTGSDESDGIRTGTGAVLELPQGGDAKYIGVSPHGLSEQRVAIENDKTLAAYKASQLMDSRTSQRESGEALRIRGASQNASLNQIALTAGEALERILRYCAEWSGLDPDEVSVSPNMDFVNDQMSGSDLQDLIKAKLLGAPIAKRSVHKIMQSRGMTDLSYDEELSIIEDEGV